MSKQNRLSEEFSRAIHQVGTPDHKLNPAEAKAFFNAFCQKFAKDGHYTYPLWEHIAETAHKKSEHNEHAWLLLALLEGEIMFFFEHDDDQNVFRIADGHKLPEIIDNCYYFPFYVASPDLSFFYAFNEHDYIIGGGEIPFWTKTRE